MGYNIGMEDRGGSRTTRIIIALAAAGVVAALYLAMANPQFRFMEGASAIKLLWARALLAGEGYTEIWRVGAPPEIVRPPGFAILVTAVVAAFGEDMLALKIVNNMFAPLGCLALFFLVNRRTRDPLVSGLIALGGFAFPHFYAHALYLEAEILFCFLFYLGLVMFERARADAFSGRLLMLGFCAVTAAACMVRSVGLVLIPASVPALTLARSAPPSRRLWWGIIIVLTWTAVGGGWMLRNQMVAPAGELTYLDKVMAGEPVESIYWLAEDHRVPLLGPPRRATPSDLAARVFTNARFFLYQAAENVFPDARKHPASAWAALFPALVVLYGLGLGLKRQRSILDFTCGLYLVVILLWPYQDNRFLLPALPFLLLYLAEGIVDVAARFSRGEAPPGFHGGPRLAITVLLAVLSASFLVSDLRILREGKKPLAVPALVKGPHFRITSPNLGAYHSLVLLEWIRTHSAPTDRVLYHSYSPCALITERQCSAIPMVGPERLMDYIEEAGITLVVVDDEVSHGGGFMAVFTPRYLAPAVEAFPYRFAELYRIEGSSARILRVIDR